MNTRAFFSVASLLGATTFALLSIRCDKDPPTRCGMGSGTALARYYLMSGPSDVTPGSGACANLLAGQILTTDDAGTTISLAPGTNTALPVTGEVVTTEEYLPDQSNAAITNSQHRSMAIEPTWIIDRIQDSELNEGDAGMLDAGPGLPATPPFSTYPYTGDSGANPQPALPPSDPTNTDRPYAWGFFDSLYPDSNGVCTAHLNASIIDLPAVPAHGINLYSSPTQSNLDTPSGAMDARGQLWPAQPATHVEYTWTNVQVLQTGASVGQQAWADLTITRDGCRATYHVALLSPETPCAGSDDAGNAIPDLSQCSATAVPDVPSPSQAQLYGSGLPVGVTFACVDMNALPSGFDAGAGGDGGGGGSPDYECVATKTAP